MAHRGVVCKLAVSLDILFKRRDRRIVWSPDRTGSKSGIRDRAPEAAPNQHRRFLPRLGTNKSGAGFRHRVGSVSMLRGISKDLGKLRCVLVVAALMGSVGSVASAADDRVPVPVRTPDSSRLEHHLQATIDTSRIVCELAPGVGVAEFSGLLKEMSGAIDSDKITRAGAWYVISIHPSRRREADVRALVSALASTPILAQASPVLLTGDPDLPAWPTHYLNIGFDPETPAGAREEMIKSVGGVQTDYRWPLLLPDAARVRLATNDGFEAMAAAARLADLEGVRFAECDMLRVARDQAIPNDPLFPSQWALHNTGQSGGVPDMDMDAPEAWDLTTGSSSVLVLVIEGSGVQLDHPDLAIALGRSFAGTDPSGAPVHPCDNHATAVASCITARMNNGAGLTGVAPGVSVAVAKLGVPAGIGCGSWSIQDSSWADALNWGLQNGARVSNTSLGGGAPGPAVADAAFSAARAAGMVHFAAAGNAGIARVGWPARLESINAVSAMDRTGERWQYSNYGASIEFAAPGVGILCADRTGSDGDSGGDYITQDGTSFASPYVAGVAALVLSRNSALNPDQIARILRASCTDLGPPGKDADFGWGMVNALKAVQLAVVPLLVEDRVMLMDASPGGNADGTLDPGESQVGVTVRLRNDGGADATGLTATLVPVTPTVTVESDASAYPDLRAGDDAPNTTPFVVSVAAGHPAGMPVLLMLTVNGAVGPTEIPISIPVGYPRQVNLRAAVLDRQLNGDDRILTLDSPGFDGTLNTPWATFQVLPIASRGPIPPLFSGTGNFGASLADWNAAAPLTSASRTAALHLSAQTARASMQRFRERWLDRNFLLDKAKLPADTVDRIAPADPSAAPQFLTTVLVRESGAYLGNWTTTPFLSASSSDPAAASIELMVVPDRVLPPPLFPTSPSPLDNPRPVFASDGVDAEAAAGLYASLAAAQMMPCPGCVDPSPEWPLMQASIASPLVIGSSRTIGGLLADGFSMVRPRHFNERVPGSEAFGQVGNLQGRVGGFLELGLVRAPGSLPAGNCRTLLDQASPISTQLLCSETAVGNDVFSTDPFRYMFWTPSCYAPERLDLRGPVLVGTHVYARLAYAIGTERATAAWFNMMSRITNPTQFGPRTFGRTFVDAVVATAGETYREAAQQAALAAALPIAPGAQTVEQAEELIEPAFGVPTGRGQFHPAAGPSWPGANTVNTAITSPDPFAATPDWLATQAGCDFSTARWVTVEFSRFSHMSFKDYFEFRAPGTFTTSGTIRPNMDGPLLTVVPWTVPLMNLAAFVDTSTQPPGTGRQIHFAYYRVRDVDQIDEQTLMSVAEIDLLARGVTVKSVVPEGIATTFTGTRMTDKHIWGRLNVVDPAIQAGEVDDGMVGYFWNISITNPSGTPQVLSLEGRSAAVTLPFDEIVTITCEKRVRATGQVLKRTRVVNPTTDLDTRPMVIGSTPFGVVSDVSSRASGLFGICRNQPYTCNVNDPSRCQLPTCHADFNRDGATSVQDLFDFLASYFGGQPRADINESMTLSVQDIFDFLAAYFAGCP